MTAPRIAIPQPAINDFCRRWKITEFALFGSAVRDDFGPDSDVDILVSFSPEVRYSLFDMVHMTDELEKIFGRPVDLVTRKAVERATSQWRREAILGALSHVPLAS